MCFTEPSDFDSWLLMTILTGWILMWLFPVPIQYYLIFRAVRKARLRVHHHGHDISASTRPTAQGTPALSKEELRLTKISMLVTFVLMLSWLPMCINHFLLYAVPSAIFGFRHCLMLLLINSSVNPYLYAWMNKHYRTAYMDILSLCMRSDQRVNVQNSTSVRTDETI